MVLCDFHGFPWGSLGFHVFPWVSMGFHGVPFTKWATFFMEPSYVLDIR